MLLSVIPHAFGPCEQTFREIISAFSSGIPEGRFRAQALFYHFLSNLAAFYSEKKDPRITQALTYMHAHFHDPSLTVEKIAEQVYVSSVFLRRLFREQLGCTPVKQLTSLRVDAAGQLLIQSGLSVSEIALQCGFSDAKYLSKVFHDATGMTPRQYRELHR